MPCGKKRKKQKIATHKRKKKLRRISNFSSLKEKNLMSFIKEDTSFLGVSSLFF